MRGVHTVALRMNDPETRFQSVPLGGIRVAALRHRLELKLDANQPGNFGAATTHRPTPEDGALVRSKTARPPTEVEALPLFWVTVAPDIVPHRKDAVMMTIIPDGIPAAIGGEA